MNQDNDSPRYEKVRTSNGHYVRGLWQNNKKFYVQMRLPGRKSASRVLLKNPDGNFSETVPQAIAAMGRARDHKSQITLKGPAAALVTVAQAIESYMAEQETIKGKRPATLKREKSGLAFWVEFCGARDVASITLETAMEFAAWRRGHEVCGRSIDLDVMALRYVLNKFKNSALRDWKKLAKPSKQVRLMEPAEIEQLCAAAEAHVANHGGQAPCEYGKQFSEYLRLLSVTGAREQETLHLTRGAVSWERGQIRIGERAGVAQEDTQEDPNVAKGKRSRVVPFSAGLKSHLAAMWLRRGWAQTATADERQALLFPSPRSDTVLTSQKKSLAVVKKKTGIADVGFHHFRHYFISQCVMAGVDFKTIAVWVGHRDGGVLVGKTYGHVNDEHHKRQAEKLNF